MKETPPTPVRNLSRLIQNNSWYKEEALRELLHNHFRGKWLLRPVAFISSSSQTLKMVPVSVQMPTERLKSTNMFFSVIFDGHRVFISQAESHWCWLRRDECLKELFSPSAEQHERCVHAPLKTGIWGPSFPLISINSQQSNEQINHHLLVIYLFCQTENTPLPQRLEAHYTNFPFHTQRFHAYITDLWFQLSSITFHFPVNILHKTFLDVSWDCVLLLILRQVSFQLKKVVWQFKSGFYSVMTRLQIHRWLKGTEAVLTAILPLLNYYIHYVNNDQLTRNSK